MKLIVDYIPDDAKCNTGKRLDNLLAGLKDTPHDNRW